jgi:hypothetical protein
LEAAAPVEVQSAMPRKIIGILFLFKKENNYHYLFSLNFILGFIPKNCFFYKKIQTKLSPLQPQYF